MKVAIVGGRDYPNSQYVIEQIVAVINRLGALDKTQLEIVSGGASGVDSIAENFAISRTFKFKCFLPQFNKYSGNRAYYERNVEIARYCDVLLAFPSPASVGTWITVKEAFNANKVCVVFPYKTKELVMQHLTINDAI